MAIHLKALLLLSLTTELACAEAPSPFADDLQRLNQQRANAIQAALEPINRIYKERLQELLSKTTEKQDLDTAIKIKAALDDLGKNNAVAPVDTKAEMRALERHLLNTKWSYAKTDVPASQQFIEFKQKGILIPGWSGGGVFHWSVSDEKLTVLIRPFIDQNVAETMILDEKLKTGVIKTTRGDIHTNLLR